MATRLCFLYLSPVSPQESLPAGVCLFCFVFSLGFIIQSLFGDAHIMSGKPERLGGEQKQPKVKGQMEFGGDPWKAVFQLLKSWQEVQTVVDKTMLKCRCKEES